MRVELVANRLENYAPHLVAGLAAALAGRSGSLLVLAHPPAQTGPEPWLRRLVRGRLCRAVRR